MSNNKRPFPNKRIFEIIDTEEKAYWLGFLSADGSVSSSEDKIELGLSIKDIGHVEKFKSFIGLENRISIREKTNSCRYSFRSKELKEDLIDKGYTPRKTLTLRFPSDEQVPKNLKHHYMRGYFDGDGWICNTEKTKCIGFIGTESFLVDAIQFFDLKRNKIGKVHSGPQKRYQLYAREELISFLDTIYKDATIYLDRKYLLYQSYK